MNGVDILSIVISLTIAVLSIFWVIDSLFSSYNPIDFKWCYKKDTNEIVSVTVIKVVKDRRYKLKEYVVSDEYFLKHEENFFTVDKVFSNKSKCEKFYMNDRIDFLQNKLDGKKRKDQFDKQIKEVCDIQKKYYDETKKILEEFGKASSKVFAEKGKRTKKGK